MNNSFNIFVSKPNALTQTQSDFYLEFLKLLEERSLVPRTLGETDFPNNAPIHAVRDLLNKCDGVIVLGFRQMLIEKGISKYQTSKESIIDYSFLPTAWNQIEAGMAFMCNVPILILCEDGVFSGVFDVGNTDKFIHQTNLTSDWLHSKRFLQPFNAWYMELIQNQK